MLIRSDMPLAVCMVCDLSVGLYIGALHLLQLPQS